MIAGWLVAAVFQTEFGGEARADQKGAGFELGVIIPQLISGAAASFAIFTLATIPRGRDFSSRPLVMGLSELPG